MISVQTDDLVFIHEILASYLPKIANKPSPHKFTEISTQDLTQMYQLVDAVSKYCYCFSPDLTPEQWIALYETIQPRNTTVVIVNPLAPSPLFYNYGPLEVSDTLMATLMQRLTSSTTATRVAPLLRGRTVHDAMTFGALSMARYGHLTPESLAKILKQHRPAVAGIKDVDLTIDYYRPEPAITEWLQVEGALLRAGEVPPVLVPRGLLLNGPTGTGKTLAAKAIAKELDLNLYRLDMASMLDMYIGNSEANLAKALHYIEHMAPCVLLIDECEKVFMEDESGGVMGRLLSELLWWLQEHTANVLTLMTTNDMAVIPSELMRPGRIDYALEFSGLDPTEIREFVTELLNSISSQPILTDTEVTELIDQIKEGGQTSQAAITQDVYRAAKIALIKTGI